MKNEKERMQEYLKEYTDAHSSIKKVEGIEKLNKGIEVSTKTAIIILTIVTLITVYLIIQFLIPKIAVFFTMNKKQFIRKIEKTYNQKFEIVEDYSSPKGNGLFIMQTKNEPKIKFYATKNSYDEWKIDYEDRYFMYLVDNQVDSIFKDIKYKITEIPIMGYNNYSFVKCEGTLEINSFNDIENACNVIYELEDFLKNKSERFNIVTQITYGEYRSYIGYDKSLKLEDRIRMEKINFAEYLCNNNKDMIDIPIEIQKIVKLPKKMMIYINGKKAKSYLESIDGDNTLYAVYDIKEENYFVLTPEVILNCDKCEIMDKSKIRTSFKFRYNGKKYGVHYKNKDIIGNQLPGTSKIQYFEQILGAKIEYDYENEIINIKL